jgi:glutathione peroxidase
LIALHNKYHNEGFSVLAFPSNDYHQELSTNADILSFWQREYPEAKFPIFAASHLPDNPIYRRLQQHLPESHVQHNFYKYLVDPTGRALALYHKRDNPMSLEPAIQELLQQFKQNKTNDTDPVLTDIQ